MGIEQTSYTVLARKWRPQKFADVVGQEHVTVTLQNALAQQRVGQGYLFIGTRGVGKTTVARILAKALNCLSSSAPVTEPCDVCEMCVAIREGTCLDVMEIDGASNRGIEEIRRLRDSVSIAPVSARFKIYIIDEVHMLTKEAFNALLKTLEEPPPHVKFFMATTEAHRVPATILSRVQKFELRRMQWNTLLTYLQRIAQTEHVAIDSGALATIARAGNGSVRDALSVFDQVLALAEDKVTEEQVTALLGWTDREIYAELHAAIVKQSVDGALGCVQRVMERGRDPEQFVLGLLQFLRNVLIARTVAGAEEIIEEPPEFLQVIKAAAQDYTPEQLLYAIDVLLELLPRMASTEAKQTSLELAVLKLMYARRRVGIDEIFARLEALESGGGGVGQGAASVAASQRTAEPRAVYQAAKPATPAVPEAFESPLKAAAPASANEVPGEASASSTVEGAGKELDAAWRALLAQTETSDPKLNAMLSHVTVSFPDDNTLVLTVAADDTLTYNTLKRKTTVSKLAQEMSGLAGRAITVEIKQAAAEQKVKRARTKEELIEEAKQTPIVKAALELFGGEITDVIED